LFEDRDTALQCRDLFHRFFQERRFGLTFELGAQAREFRVRGQRVQFGVRKGPKVSFRSVLRYRVIASAESDDIEAADIGLDEIGRIDCDDFRDLERAAPLKFAV